MRWVLRIKNLRGLVKKGVFEGGGSNTKLSGLWDYAHYEKKDTLSLLFWLKGFPVQNTNIKYSYYTVIME